MKNKYFIVEILLLSIQLMAQDAINIYSYPTSSNFSEQVSVSITSVGNSFGFQYEIFNDRTSVQEIWTFHVRVDKSPIMNISSPLGWRGSITTDARGERKIRWIASDSTFYLPRGSRTRGFTYISLGLPSVTIYNARAWAELPNAEAEPDSFIGAEQWRLGKIGVTIGPSDPPDPFASLAFLDTLLSYTRQSVQLGWLKSGRDNDCDGDEKPQDGVSKNLEKRLEKAKKELTKGNNLKASKELEKFIKKVERVSKRTDVMTSEAYALLKYNAEYLVGRIITLPAKPAGTVLQQIDELKAELTQQSNKKNIGGVLLVKSLSFLADQAKKQLQKPLPSTNDSAMAALSIAAFQLFVDEVWELTGALSGKSKKLPALYVYDEAYIQLHYRAKYILESLPAPRTLIDMKSVETDDETRKELDAMRQMTKEQ